MVLLINKTTEIKEPSIKQCPEGYIWNWEKRDCVKVPKNSIIVKTQEEYDRLNKIYEEARKRNAYAQKYIDLANKWSLQRGWAATDNLSTIGDKDLEFVQIPGDLSNVRLIPDENKQLQFTGIPDWDPNQELLSSYIAKAKKEGLQYTGKAYRISEGEYLPHFKEIKPVLAEEQIRLAPLPLSTNTPMDIIPTEYESNVRPAKLAYRSQTIMEPDPNRPGDYRMKELRQVPYASTSIYRQGDVWDEEHAPRVLWIDNQGNEVEVDPRKTQGNTTFTGLNLEGITFALGGIPKAQDGGQKDKWGRSLNDKWYGFDPQTKKYTIAPYKIQELRNQAAGVSKYDPLEQRALPSETTQQAAKNLPSQKKSVNEAIGIKSAEKDATIQAVKDLPLLTEEQKNEILMDPRKLDEYSYLTRLAHQPDTVKESIPYSARERAWDIITNPFDAFEYSVRTGDVSNMPRNYNQMRMAGIDPSAGGGANAVGNTLNTFTNLFDAGDKVVRNVGEGNYGTAALEAMRFIPGARVNTGVGSKLYNATTKAPAIPGMPSYSKDLFYSMTHGRTIPQYKTATRWQPDAYPESLVQAGKKELTPEQQSLTGSWYGYSPSNKKVDPDASSAVGFYMRTRPGAGNINTLKLSQRQIDELEAAMPDFAKGMSGKVNTQATSADWAKGELNIPLEVRQKAKTTRFDVNPREYVPSQLPPDIDPTSIYSRTLGDMETGTFVNDVINSQYKPIMGIPRKYFSYQVGGAQKTAEDWPLVNWNDDVEKDQYLPEATAYANPTQKKLQGNLIEKLQQAKRAYNRHRENLGLTQRKQSIEGDSSIASLKEQIASYKKELDVEKKSFQRAQTALKVLKTKDPDNWKDAKLNDVMSAKGVDALRNLYSEGKISEGTHRDFYNNFGQFYDRETTRTTADDQEAIEESWLGPKDEKGRRRWMSDPKNVAKVAAVTAYGAALAPAAAMAAPGLTSAYNVGRTALNYAPIKALPGLTANTAARAYWLGDTLINDVPETAALTKEFLLANSKDPDYLDKRNAALMSAAFTGLGLAGGKGSNVLKGSKLGIPSVVNRRIIDPVRGAVGKVRDASGRFSDALEATLQNPLSNILPTTGTIGKLTQRPGTKAFLDAVTPGNIISSYYVGKNLNDIRSGDKQKLIGEALANGDYTRAALLSGSTALGLAPLAGKRGRRLSNNSATIGFRATTDFNEALIKAQANRDIEADSEFNLGLTTLRLVPQLLARANKQKGGVANDSYVDTLSDKQIKDLIQKGYKIEYLD
jgi:hypothetical protein